MKLISTQAIDAFRNAWQIETYSPENVQYRVRRYYDEQPIDSVAGASNETDFFNTALSSRALHGRGLWGCNLPEPGRLPGNTSFIGARIEFRVPLAVTAAKVLDAQKIAEYGLCKGVIVANKAQLDEFEIGPCMAREGMQPLYASDGGGAVGLAYFGVSGIDEAEALSQESYFGIRDMQSFRIPVGYNGASDLSADLVTRCRIVGVEIQSH